jgi:hypothetical protein
MTTETTDHTAAECSYPWCVAHRPCRCPYAASQPHLAVGCRYDQADTDDP